MSDPEKDGEKDSEYGGRVLEAVLTSDSGNVRPYCPDDDVIDSNMLSRISSRQSEQHIYGDLDEETIALERASTRATVASRAGQSSLYRPQSIIEVDGNDDLPAGEEFSTEDPELVTWESAEDPQNPRNWSKARKTKITALASLQTLVPTVASSILAPAVSNILKTYDNSNLTVGSLMVSIMVLVWGFSAVVWAPIAEVAGRRNVLIASAAGNLAFNIACGFAPTTASMLVFRALAGAFNSAPIAISAGSLADVYDDSDRQWPLAIWGLAPACGPGLAPVISGFIAEYTTWKWVFWVVVILQGVMLGALVLFFDETYPQLILRKKCRVLRKLSGNQHLHTVWDLTAVPFHEELRMAVVRPILFLVLNPVVLLLATYLAFTYGFMYLILTNFPNLWTDVYHYSKGIGGLMYLGYSIGMLIGVFFWTAAINYWYDRAERLGKGKLEQRLFLLPFATITLAAGMFWYGWSAEAKLSWPMPTVGIGIFSFSLFCVFQCVQSYIVSLNARLAGSAIAACVWGRCMLGGTFPLFGRAMYNHLGYGWACTVVALLAIVLGVPWPIGIYIYGPRLREWADKNVKID